MFSPTPKPMSFWSPADGLAAPTMAELEIACGGFDSFGSSGLGTPIHELGLIDDEPQSGEADVWSTKDYAQGDNTASPWPSSFALTHNADGTFSAVDVYGMTRVHDLDLVEEAPPTVAAPTVVASEDVAFYCGLQRLTRGVG